MMTDRKFRAYFYG